MGGKSALFCLTCQS
ncbi:MAG: hypothetical protein ACYCY2_08515 [Acidithiobacillus ferriphilus]